MPKRLDAISQVLNILALFSYGSRLKLFEYIFRKRDLLCNETLGLISVATGNLLQVQSIPLITSTVLYRNPLYPIAMLKLAFGGGRLGWLPVV